ncbi:AMP-binding protein [Lacrimispora sp.]|uniref:AMP-binding protein n=1 Tax=Lacrimispora sp. TaxID=2719234 RepID=UPI0032E4DF58
MHLFDKEKIYGDRILAVDDKDRKVTYDQLDSFSGELYSKVGGKKLIFILCENTVESLFGYLGCLKTGIVPLMLESRIHPSLLNSLIREYHPAFLYVPETCTEKAEGSEVIWQFGSYCLCRRNEKLLPALYCELSLLLTTSGSTGSPKLVRQSSGNIDANGKSIASYLEIDVNERPITTLPMNYTYGLSIINSHVLMGCTLLLTKSGVLEPAFWDFAGKYRASSLAGVPYTYQILKRIGFMEMDLPDLKTMTQAGGKLPPSLHKEFALYAKRTNRKFIVMYGQTEATARMGYLPADQSLEKCGSMGIAIPGGRFWLEDEQGNEVIEPDIPGELVYRGKNVTLGYACCKDDLIKQDEWRGVLHTGDIASRDSEGYYFITGRKKRFIKVSGSRVNLDEVERLLKEQYEGIDFACVGTDDNLTIYTDCSLTDAGKEILDYLYRVTEIGRAAAVRYRNKIPKNESGKTLYQELETTADNRMECK